MADLYCGLDLGGTKVLGLVVDASGGEPLVVRKVSTPTGEDAVVDALASVAAELIAEAGADRVRAVGLGAPGLVDRSGTLRYGPNVAGLIDVSLADLLHARLGIPAVVDNDATCAAWGEHERGAAQGANHSITVTLGTGIGAGLVIGGRLVRGANGMAGEPGHTTVDPNGPPCPCGRRGCWERYASGAGLARMARDAAEAGQLDGVLSRVGGDAAVIRGEDVVEAARAGDAETQVVLDELAWWTALGIANLIAVLDPEVVVLGGGLIDAADLWLDQTRRRITELTVAAGHRDLPPVVAAVHGAEAAALGAALLAARA